MKQEDLRITVIKTETLKALCSRKVVDIVTETIRAKLNPERWLIMFMVLFFSFNSLAEEDNLFDERGFSIKLSIYNNIRSSQNAATDLAFSAISELAYLLSDSYPCDGDLYCRIKLAASYYAAALITILNHEISGHILRILEFDGKVTEMKLDGFFSAHVGYELRTLKPQHLQAHAIVGLGGVQADYLLSQKLSDHLMFNKKSIDPITAAGYFFSITDQIGYNYHTSECDGHDLKSYVNIMEQMYGYKSMNIDTLKSHGFLSLLDPILFASMYSMFTAEAIDIPLLNLNGIDVMPFARSIFTPYGVIEKKIGAYIFTDHTPIKVGLSIGEQFKTSEPLIMLSNKGYFAGLKEGEAVEKHITCGLDISVFRLFNINKLNIGGTAAFWRQPELFVEDPYREKPKNGFMFIVNTSYEASKDFNILCNIGYKSKGFVPGQHINETFMASFTLEYRM